MVRDRFTARDAFNMVDRSTDWKVGLEAFLLKWEQLREGDYSYGFHARCGFCFVKDNRKVDCVDCPSLSICDCLGGATPQEVLDMLLALEL